MKSAPFFSTIAALGAGLAGAVGCSSSSSAPSDEVGTLAIPLDGEESRERCQGLRFRISRARCERALLAARAAAELAAELAAEEELKADAGVGVEPPVVDDNLAEDANGRVGFCCGDGDCLCHEGAVNEDTATGRGQFDVDSFTVRGGGEFGGGTVFFPTNAEAPFSAFVMCPGFTARQSSIRDWGPFFASHGIVLMTIDTLSTDDPVNARDDQLLAALDSLREQNSRSGGPLQGALDLERLGVSGWSMGGGGSWLAGRATPELKSVVSLAGHHRTAGGARAVASNLNIPTLMMAGSDDPAFLGGGNQSQEVFEVMSDATPKMLFEVLGEGHFVWGTPRTNGGAVGRYVLSWQKVFLDEDERYLPFLLEEGPNASDFRSNL